MNAKLKRFLLVILIQALRIIVPLLGSYIVFFYSIKWTTDYFLGSASKRTQIEEAKKRKKASNNSKKQTKRKPQDSAYPEVPKKSWTLDDLPQNINKSQQHSQKNEEHR